jgi:hypothetical protein
VKRTSAVVSFMLGSLAAACGSSNDGGGSTIEPMAGHPGGGSPATASGGSTGGTASASKTVGTGGGIVVGSSGSTSAGSSTGTGGLDPGMACAASSVEGERIPVDLYFMVDTTGSMNCPVPDSASAPCEVDPGPPYSDITRWTIESKALTSFMDSKANEGLSVGIGFFPSSKSSCDSTSYTTPKQEIAALPGAASSLDAAVLAQKPAGNTPTVASLTGAIDHAKAWALAHAGHRVAVVYSTDGYPKGCDGTNTIANAVNVATAGLASSPPIQTYVLGLGRNLSSLNQVAAAGGTEKAYLIETGTDAAAQLAKALDNIRTRSLFGCTYTVPTPPPGQELDYGKVNVRFTPSSGQPSDVLQDANSNGCTEGWEYSADKTQLNLCGNACDAIKADPGGKIEVLFGCMTQVDVPR